MKDWEKDPKRRIKKQNAEKIPWFFFIYSYSLKKGKREGQGIQSSLRGCKEKRLFKEHHFLMESTRKS